MNDIWPPAPKGQLPPGVKDQNDKPTSGVASLSFWLSLVGTLTIFIVHVINYTGLFQDSSGVWFFQITSLDSRIDSEFFYFEGYLITGYFLIGLGTWLGFLYRDFRRGRKALVLGICLIVLDIILRVGVPLVEPKDRTVHILTVLSVEHSQNHFSPPLLSLDGLHGEGSGGGPLRVCVSRPALHWREWLGQAVKRSRGMKAAGT